MAAKSHRAGISIAIGISGMPIFTSALLISVLRYVAIYTTLSQTIQSYRTNIVDYMSLRGDAGCGEMARCLLSYITYAKYKLQNVDRRDRVDRSPSCANLNQPLLPY